MTQTTLRDASVELSRRIKSSRTDPADVDVDEAGRPPSDKPPAFAEALMFAKPNTIEGAAKLTEADWDIIDQALEHAATCGNG